MAFTPKALADGQVSNVLGTIFTATAAIGTYLKSLTLFNTNAAQQTVIIYLNRTGVDRVWKRFVLEQNEYADCVSGAESIILESGDLIKAVTTTDAVVDYTISGVEES